MSFDIFTRFRRSIMTGSRALSEILLGSVLETRKLGQISKEPIDGDLEEDLASFSRKKLQIGRAHV